jgi:hypothetical protein
MPLDQLLELGFQIRFVSHARAILETDFPDVLNELGGALSSLTIPIEEIIGSGGGETKGTQRLRRALANNGWAKHHFEIVKTINGVQRESQSHEVDHVRVFPDRGTVALEIEWNNKDPFFDRDLENFKRLHAEGAISVGVIVTRGESMQDEMRAMVRRFAEEKNLSRVEDLAGLNLYPTRRQQADYARRIARGSRISFAEAWSSSFVQDKYGAATTHWRKLDDRIQRGVGNPCPLLLVGLPSSLVTFGESAQAVNDLLEEASKESDQP